MDTELKAALDAIKGSVEGVRQDVAEVKKDLITLEDSVSERLTNAVTKVIDTHRDGIVADLEKMAERRHNEAMNLAREQHSEQMEQRRAFHAEQMRKFREVTEDAKREKEIEDLQKRVAFLEELLLKGGGTKS